MATKLPRGYLSLVLHAHLPYVRHPEYDSFYEENWLFEALSETYLPLLWTLENLATEGLEFRLGLSLSPTLTAMLQDKLLQQRYQTHLDKLIRLTEAECVRGQGSPAAALASLYLAHWQRCREHAPHTILPRLAELAKQGYLELLSCAATHAYLPLWQQQPALVRAQLALACESHRQLFGAPPKGLWLPECGYYPGLENHLKDLGVSYFFVDHHACAQASETPRYAHYAPLLCPNGVAALPRDPGCSQQVWSADSGYPGAAEYRDFYRDIALELEPSALQGFLPDGHPRIPSGLKYHAITGQHVPLALKHWYDPQRASVKAAEDAADFYQRCVARLTAQAPRMPIPPLLMAPYDAELFGHWWFEGPQWLAAVIRQCHRSDDMQLISPADYLQRHGKTLQIAVPSASSWGESGYHQVWLNSRNDWLYPPLLQAGKQLTQLAQRFADGSVDAIQQRYLNQAARTLLLAQASDWAFMLKNGVGAEYAQQRFETQLGRFTYLRNCLEQSETSDLAVLESAEKLDNLFPELDYRIFA